MKLSQPLLLTLGLSITSILPTLSLAQTPSPSPVPVQSETPHQWRKMTEAEEDQAWQHILNSPLGIAALNQLAIEGFINPTCPKTFYVDEGSGGFLSLMQVKCVEAKGISIALDYDEIRVIFSRFEDNIENFTIERVFQQEGMDVTPLPN